jgi:hypothetical protein
MIDRQQKKEEHQFTIRNAYVTNKIKTAETEIHRVEVMMFSYLTMQAYFSGIISDIAHNTPNSRPTQESADKFNQLHDATFNNLQTSNTTSLYFNINDEQAINDAVGRIVSIQHMISPHDMSIKNKENAETCIQYIITLNNLLNLRISFIRTELARYDIL